jgi:hypothetical protein
MFNLTETSKKRIINKHLKTICTCHSQTSDNNDSFITTDNISNYSNQIEKKEDIRFINTAEYLYTNQGNSHIPIDILMDRGLAPLTRWTQTEIYKHQNPTDCSKSIFLVTEGWSAGFGSTMHIIGSHLAYAMQNNYVLIWGANSCDRFVDANNCTKKGCGCIFKELSRCSSDEHFKIDEWEKVSGGNFHGIIPDIFKNALLSKIPSMTEEEKKYWWRGQSVGFLMRLNDISVSEISSMRKNIDLNYMSGGQLAPFPLPIGTIHAHIRHGDKYKETSLVPSEKYVRAFQSMIQQMPNSFSRVFFVSSDDAKALEICKDLTENLKMSYIYTKLDRMHGGHDEEKWNKSKPGSQQRVVLGYILQLLMALESDAWIGTRASNINRLIDELRCVWVDKCHSMYVEVGSILPGSYEW